MIFAQHLEYIYVCAQNILHKQRHVFGFVYTRCIILANSFIWFFPSLTTTRIRICICITLTVSGALKKHATCRSKRNIVACASRITKNMCLPKVCG